MRKTLLAWLALASALCLPAVAEAQVPRVKITGVRAGYTGAVDRSGAQTGRLKSGMWAPLYIDVQVGSDRLNAGEYDLVVETTDSDDLQNVYVERRFLPTIEPKESPTLLSYVRPGSSQSDVNITIRSRLDGRTLASASLKGNRGDYAPVEPSTFIYLTLGGPLPGMKRALSKRPANAAFNPDMAPEEEEPEENTFRRFARVDQVEQMPTSWFGYQAVDAVILATGSKGFIDKLNEDNNDQVKARIDALAEWVRRGGRLVISVAHNHQELNAVLEKLRVIDVQVRGQVPKLRRLTSLTRWAGAADPYQARGEADLEVANLIPGKGVRVLAAEGAGKEAVPLILSAPYGLGRVMVVAVDVDQPPFTAWRSQRNFWDVLRRDTEPASLDNPQHQANMQFRGGWMGQPQELATRLVDGLEMFPDVPVISFGWVALFILVYIIIVGPLDYFFLKKVVKRLELTWITFPAVVIVISAVAYFAAYWLKGNDLRINKVDVVDIDLHGSRAYGTSWFTLFSPRIQNYTVGIEPNTPSWGQEPPSRNTTGKERKEDWARDRYSPHVGWMGRPENIGFSGRGGSGGLFRRAYDYAPEATGLIGVPIQVWSTKTFAASYDRAIGEKELIEADLKFRKVEGNPKVGGTIISHLPVELKDVVLIYAGSAYNIERLPPGEPVNLDPKNITFGGRGDVDLQTWFNQGYWKPSAGAQPTRVQRFGPGASQPAQPPGMYIKSILFHGTTGDNQANQMQNSTLRALDQRWRLDRNNKDEVLLVGRAEPPAGQKAEGSAEEIVTGPLSPTRLWLGSLPGIGKRESLVGTLSQETYVRVFIPVAPQ